MSADQYDFYKRYMEKLQIRAEEAVKEAQKKAFAEYFELANDKIRKIYKDTITDFYNSYDRSFYEPRGRLYKLIQTKITDEYLDIYFDPSQISYRNGYSGEDGLYDQVFRHGWHGGANIGGKMLIPWTSPAIAYDGENTPWSFPRPWEKRIGIKHGWTPAEKAPISPLDDFKQRIDAYHQTEYQHDYNNIWNKYKQNIKIDMS